MMKKQYAYSNDKEFLSKIDRLRVKDQWVKITLLEYRDEKPIESIEGKISSGSLTKSEGSAVRRTCNLTCAVDAYKYNPDDIKASYSISKKIFLELGITNSTKEYPDEDIIWFPQGVFFITSFAITASSSGAASISLQFKDKMAQLDGTVGGVLPATVRFDTVTTIVDGMAQTKKALVYDIIMETVNHFGGEDLSNIIIDDVPAKAKRIIRWMGNESIWIYPILGGGKLSYDICFASDLDEKQSAHTPVNYNGQIIGAKEYKVNQDIGYMYEDFVYDDELIFNAGAKVTEVLDKIKSWLGNYEYFYDEQGQFHFQEIKNYLNNRESGYIWDKILGTKDTDYLYESTHGKTVYTFDDNINLVSITNTPVYENIKNDFIVEGTVDSNGIKKTCRYHLVIDDKPEIALDGYNNILMYTDPLTGDTTIASPKIVEPTKSGAQWTWSLPEFAESGVIYGLLDEPQNHIIKKTLRDMNDFADTYNALVKQENDLITADESYTLTADVGNYLFALLENYMGYEDTAPYKEEYRDVIFTLARQLRRYKIAKRPSSLITTVEYYEALYSWYMTEISNYGEVVSERIAWCGGLLQLLYDLFTDIDSSHKPGPDGKYINTIYWPAVNIKLKGLWENMTISDNVDTLRRARKSRCTLYVEDAKVRQKELSVLVKQYTQIINNYNVQIEVSRRNNTATTSAKLIAARDLIQNQLNVYEKELDICSERLNVLYATLTSLGALGSNIEETYYTVDVHMPVRTSSFWYYNDDSTQDNYGWNELIWYQYYCNKTGSTSYYPDGLGAMTYIDYSNIKWENTNFTDSNCPSMNRYSSWYQNYYIDYAKEHGLPYFKDGINDAYIPVDWRTELLLRGLRAEANGTDPGHYYQELKASWPTIYDFKAEQLTPSSIDYLDYFVGKTGVIFGDTYDFGDFGSNTAANVEGGTSDGNKTMEASFKPGEEAAVKNFLLNYENGSYCYFFDMIDSSSPTWGEYSVKNIGRRANVRVSDSVNCVFAPRIPDFAFINVSGLTTQDRREKYAELSNIAETIIQVTDEFHQNFATGGLKQSAYEQVRYDLVQYTSYQNTISITAVPCFYLEPNTLVQLNDRSTNTYGDYIVKNISIPLGGGNNMSVTMSKTMERI